jgi:hypothetical protein
MGNQFLGMSKQMVILGAGESGVGAALLARLRFEVFCFGWISDTTEV